MHCVKSNKDTAGEGSEYDVWGWEGGGGLYLSIRVSIGSSDTFFFAAHGEGPPCTPPASHPLPGSLPLVYLMPHAADVQQVIHQAQQDCRLHVSTLSDQA